MEETYQLIEGSPTLRDLDAENGFLWCARSGVLSAGMTEVS